MHRLQFGNIEDLYHLVEQEEADTRWRLSTIKVSIFELEREMNTYSDAVGRIRIGSSKYQLVLIEDSRVARYIQKFLCRIAKLEYDHVVLSEKLQMLERKKSNLRYEREFSNVKKMGTNLGSDFYLRMRAEMCTKVP